MPFKLRRGELRFVSFGEETHAPTIPDTNHLGRKLFYDIHEIHRHLKSIERF